MTGIFDTSNDQRGPTAGRAGLTIGSEDLLEALRRRHRREVLGWRGLFRIRAPDMPSLPAPPDRVTRERCLLLPLCSEPSAS